MRITQMFQEYKVNVNNSPVRRCSPGLQHLTLLDVHCWLNISGNIVRHNVSLMALAYYFQTLVSDRPICLVVCR